MLAYSGGKAFTSTGTSHWQEARYALEHSVGIETAAGSTGAFQILTRSKGGTATSVLSSGTMGASSLTTNIYAGVYHEIAVRVKTLTSTGTLTAKWFGND